MLGMGFTFDAVAAAKGASESLETMHALISKNPRNAERIFPYIGGEEINNSPTHIYHRYVIDFSNYPLRRDPSLPLWSSMSEKERDACLNKGVVPHDYAAPVAADWEDLLNVLEQRVKPSRLKSAQKSMSAHGRRAGIWWQHYHQAHFLYGAIVPLKRVLVTNAQASPHSSFAIIPKSGVFANSLNIFAFESLSAFAVLQSSVHEFWARFFSSTLEDRLRYNPSDCFRTFPFPAGFENDPALERAGEAYHTFRAELMLARNEGLTTTYNRFHARGENSADIARLRTLHHEMDVAVLRASGWNDLADRAVPEFIEQEADEGKTPKTRLDWPSDLKDEVLARLLALNATRAAEERAAGLVAADEGDDEEIEDGDAE